MVHRYKLIIFLSILLILVPTLVAADDHSVSMAYTSYDHLGGDGLVPNCWCRLGQRLVIPDRIVTVIGYTIWRIGNPTGNISFSIYNATSNGLITSKTWGDASSLTVWGSGSGHTGVTLDEPIRISGEVRICVEYFGGTGTDYCVGGYYAGNRITGEYYTGYRYGTWHDMGEAVEGSYWYSYMDVDEVGDKGHNYLPALVVIPIGLGLYFMRRNVKNKRQREF